MRGKSKYNGFLMIPPWHVPLLKKDCSSNPSTASYPVLNNHRLLKSQPSYQLDRTGRVFFLGHPAPDSQQPESTTKCSLCSSPHSYRRDSAPRTPPQHQGSGAPELTLSFGPKCPKSESIKTRLTLTSLGLPSPREVSSERPLRC